MRYTTDQMRAYAGPLDKIDLSIGEISTAMKEAADEIDRLRQALVTVKVNLMRNGPSEALYDYISDQLKPEPVRGMSLCPKCHSWPCEC